MKFVLLSDVHATSKTPIGRKDDLLETFLAKFEFVLEYARRHNCLILQAGDFFHRPRDWYLLFYLMRMLKKYGVKILAVYGSHDMYLYSDVQQTPTSLGILARAGLVKVLNAAPVKLIDGVRIYGASVGEAIPKCHVTKSETNILVIHAPISEAPLYPGQKYRNAKFFARRHKEFDLILCGDIHRTFLHLRNNNAIVNAGPMLRYEATEYNFTHVPCFFTFETEYKTFNKISIPHQVAKKVLSRVHLQTKQHINEVMADFVQSLTDMPNVTTDILENLERYIEQEKIDDEVKEIIAGVIEDGSD